MREQMITDHSCGVKCMSWTGVVAGALIAVGLSFLLNMFGASIGLTAFTTSTDGATTIAMGGYAGMVIGIVAIMYFSGWVAGFFARPYCVNKNFGALHGITAWCLALVIMVIIGAQTSKFVTTNMHMLTDRKVETAKVFNVVDSVINKDTKVAARAVEPAPAISEQRAAELLSIASMLTFALFFIGAIFSAIGGYCGLKCED